MDQILRMPEVLHRTGLSRTTLWRRVKASEFPQPVRLGGPSSRAVGWRAEDVQQWVRGLTALVVGCGGLATTTWW